MTATFDTIEPADSVEFCPHSKAQDLFVCGTYELIEDGTSDNAVARAQRRRGRCLLFEALPGDAIRQVQEIPFPAIPDMKWSHISDLDDPILSIADTEGNVTICELQLQSRQLKEIDKVSCAPSDVLCLSLDWSNRRCPSRQGSLVTSLSNGKVALLQPKDQSCFSMTESWQAHDYESWIVAWNYWDTNVVYSGGDDVKLKGWDVRQPRNSPTFVNKRFGGGVTSIQSHPHVEHLFAVGSYDGIVRLFDARKPLSELQRASVGGGAWRVKWHPSSNCRRMDLLVACMHDGYKVVRFDVRAESLNDSDCDGVVVKHFVIDHGSLAYGVDWSYVGGNDGSGDGGGERETTVVSCSFYDHMLRLWTG